MKITKTAKITKITSTTKRAARPRRCASRPTTLAVALALLLVSSCAAARAASFDCSKARTPQEKAICGSPALSALDSQLSIAYKAAIAGLSPATTASMRGDEAEWLHWVATVCDASKPQPANTLAKCMLQPYTGRRSFLASARERHAGITFVMRSKSLAVADIPSDTPAGMSPMEQFPGWGQLLAGWYQADSTQPGWVAWNAGAEKIVRTLVFSNTGDPGKVAGPWNAKWAQDGDTTVTSNLLVVQGDRVSFNAAINAFGHSAAHPSAMPSELNWLLSQRREMRVSDVFRPGSGWEAVVLAQWKPVTAGNSMFESDIRPAIEDIGNWTLDPKGLSIYFEDIPTADVTVPWTSLQPFLASGFVKPR